MWSKEVMVLIPAYNEEENIGSVISRVNEYAENVVVVDDSSTDRTPKIAEKKGATVIPHAINIGVGGAVRTGFSHAIEKGYDYVILLDADGQHDPDYIPKLLDVAFNKDCDIVIGSRFLNESYEEYSAVRRIGIKFFTRLVSFLGDTEISDITSGYRVYKVESLKKLSRNQDEHWAIEQTLEASRKNFEIEEVSVEMPTREEGQSQFDFQTFFWYPIRMIDVILRVIIFRR